MTKKPISVFIVDDHAVVRRGIASFLELVDDICIVGDAADGVEALERLKSLDAFNELPGVVLLDLQLPRMDGAATAREIHARFPSVRTVILTSFAEPERVHAALASGASGYVLKDADPGDVETAIRAAHKGEMFLDAAVARRVAQQVVAPKSGLGSLSKREREVLVLVARGLSNSVIATELAITERTARTHVSNVLAKMNLTSRTQAALVAVREGLVQP